MVVKNTFFYCGETFGSTKEIQEKPREHLVATRRNLTLVKNDKERVRAKCLGQIPICGPSESAGLDTGPNKIREDPITRGIKRKERMEVDIDSSSKGCPWLLYVTKLQGCETSSVRTYKDEHKCLQSREIKSCDYKFLSKQIKDQVQLFKSI